MTTTADKERVLARAEQIVRDAATPAEAEAAIRQLTLAARQIAAAVWTPYPWQHPHTHPEGWVSERAPGVCDERCLDLPPVRVPVQGYWLQRGGRGCVAGWTRVYLPDTGRHERIDALAAAGRAVRVLALTGDGPSPRWTDGAPFLKGWAHTWEVRTEAGARLTATDQHRLLTPQGWMPLAHVHVGQPLGAGAPAPPPEASLLPSMWPGDVRRLTGTPEDCPDGYLTCHRSGGPQPHPVPAAARVPAPSLTGADGRTRDTLPPDAQDAGPRCSPRRRRGTRPARTGYAPVAPWAPDGGCPAAPSPAVPPHPSDLAGHLSPRTSYPPQTMPGAGHRRTQTAPESVPLPSPGLRESAPSYPHPTSWDRVVSVTYMGWLPFYDMTVPGPENYAAEGLWHHNTGKTEGAAHFVNTHAEGPPCDPRAPGGHRLTIVAPTQADAVTSCITGVSGIQAINPGVTIATSREGTLARWPNGTVARVVGAHTPKDIDRLRAWTNVCCVWVEEAAAMVHLRDVLDQIPFTLRLGPRGHGVITTTPKNRPEITALIEGHRDLPTIPRAAVQTWGRTEDADRLHPAIRAALEGRFGGTTLGRQELAGEQIQTVEGALWVMRQTYADPQDDRPGIDNDRVPHGTVTWGTHNPDAPEPVGQVVHRTVITLDPSGGGDDEAGLLVLGAIGNHGYVLADLSGNMSSDRWARAAVQAYYDYGAEGIAYEKGWGDLVPNIIRSVTLTDGRRGDQVPLFPMPTKVGKRLRAEPVQAVYQQHRIHHVGPFPALEDQLTTWVPGETTDSPDRLDALVHGFTYLLIRTVQGSIASPAAPGVAGPTIPGRTGVTRSIRR